jgi:hypothetical protein
MTTQEINLIKTHQQDRGVRRLKLLYIVESQIRRSPRLKEINKGFKADSCSSRKCLTCNPNPPDLSHSMIQKIGSKVCKIDENLLTEKTLNQKKKRSDKITNNKNNMKENMGPVDTNVVAQCDPQITSLKGVKTSKNARKQVNVKMLKPTADIRDFQDEEGADSSALEEIST